MLENKTGGSTESWALDRPASRRAIMFADLAESVRLYQQFEARTIQRWRRFVAVARDSLAQKHGGRLVRTTGDGLLFEFEAVNGAVAAAFELHQTLSPFNAPDEGDAALWLRIGLHEADIIADERELWGSGVNLAARLASAAQPGQTAASAEVRLQLFDGVQARVEDVGLRYMKHVDEPVRVFLLHAPGQSIASATPSSADMRPALAVVPFVALPADPEHDALGHAMADDIIASLSRHPGLRVLSRASTAGVRGVALELPRLRELLGAAFLLSGNFYARGNRIRLAAELCELRGGEVLWAGSIHGDVDALFEGQDDLVPHLVAQVSQHMLAHELSRVRSLPMDSLASYSLYLGAAGLLNSLAARDLQRASEVLEHLGERHPRQATPNAMLSELHLVRFSQGASADPRASLQAAWQQAQQALEKDGSQPASLVAAGAAQSFLTGDYVSAAKYYRQALEYDPHHARAWARLSETLSEEGQHEQALQAATQAISLSPLDPQRCFYECAAARTAYMMQRWDLAATHSRTSLRLNALHGPAHLHLIAALWQSGEHESARQAASNYAELMPGVGIAGNKVTDRQALLRSRFVQAVHAAGVPL